MSNSSGSKRIEELRYELKQKEREQTALVQELSRHEESVIRLSEEIESYKQLYGADAPQLQGVNGEIANSVDAIHDLVQRKEALEQDIRILNQITEEPQVQDGEPDSKPNQPDLGSNRPDPDSDDTPDF